MWQKIKSFLKDLFKPKPQTTDIAEHERKKAYEKEKIRLAKVHGKRDARGLYKQDNAVVKKSNWQGKLQGFSDVLDDTFKPSIAPIKKSKKQLKEMDDGISPTF